MLDTFLSLGAENLVQERREVQLRSVLGEKVASVDLTKLGGFGTDFLDNFTTQEGKEQAMALEEQEMLLENTIKALEESGRDSTEARRDLEELRFKKQLLHAQSFSSTNEEPPMPQKTNDIDGTTTPNQDNTVGSQISSKLASSVVNSIAEGMLKEALPGLGGAVNAVKAMGNTKGLTSAVGEKVLKSVVPHAIAGATIGAATSDDTASGALKGALVGGLAGGAFKGYQGVSKIQAASPKMNFSQATNKFVTGGIKDIAKQEGITGFNKNLKALAPKAPPSTAAPVSKPATSAVTSAVTSAPAAAPAAAKPGAAPAAPGASPTPAANNKSINFAPGRPNTTPAPVPPMAPTPSGKMPVTPSGTQYSHAQAQPQSVGPNTKPEPGLKPQPAAAPTTQNSASLSGVKQQAPTPAPPAAAPNTPANSPAAPVNASQQAAAAPPAAPATPPGVNMDNLSTSQRLSFEKGNPVYDAAGKVMIPANPAKFQAANQADLASLNNRPNNGVPSSSQAMPAVPAPIPSPSSGAATGIVQVARIPSAAMPSVKAASIGEPLLF